MEKCISHTEGTFEPKPGICLYEQWWQPSETPKALIVIVHGIAEHSGRYAHVAEYLCQSGYAVGAFDLRGHGRSQGKRAYIQSFDDLLDDLQYFLQRATEKASQGSIFLLGHSLGSGIVVKYLIDRPLDGIRGALLSGPMIMVGESVPPILVKVANVLGTLTPNLPVLQLDQDTVSRDPDVVERYDSDPMNFRGKLAARTGAEINRTFQYLQANLKRISLPLLIMQGGADRLVNPAGSRLLYEHSTSTDKTLKIYEGLYHEILNEPEKEQVMAEMVVWMGARI